LDRRRLLAATTTGAVLLLQPQQRCHGVEIPSIAAVPSWTLLLPVVDLENALLEWSVKPNEEDVREPLAALQNKGLFSSKNFIMGVGARYVNLIKYDDIDAELVRSDRDARFNGLLACSTSIDAAANANADDVSKKALGTAAAALGQFLERCPAKDVAEAKRLLAALRAADLDGDGALSEREFADAALNDLDRIAVVWGVFGTTLVENMRPRYDAAVSLDVLKLSSLPQVPNDFKALVAMSAV